MRRLVCGRAQFGACAPVLLAADAQVLGGRGSSSWAPIRLRPSLQGTEIVLFG